MGCGGSLPKADEFLVEQIATGNLLIPGLPVELTMDPWQQVARGKPGKDNRPQGVGSRQVLAIYGDGEKPVATLNMPPEKSLGIGADLLDTEGNALAWLRSTSSLRHLPIEGGSYNIFAARPLMDGQAGQEDGKYLWATVKQSAWGNKCTVLNSAGQPTFEGSTRTSAPPENFILKTADGQGTMLSGKTSGNPKRHAIHVAKGADPGLSICIMYASKLICDEEYSNT